MSRVWTWIADRRRWIEAVAVYTVLHLLTFILPQAPTLPKESPAFTRWLAGIRPIFGDRTGMWAELGIFTLRSSLILRLTLGTIGLLTLVQLASLWEYRQQLNAGTRRRMLSLSLSGVLILIGWFAHIQWGWVESGVIAWPDQPVVVRSQELGTIRSQGVFPILTRHYGLFLVPEGERTGLTIRAFDPEGNELSLLASVRDDPKAVIRSVMTDQSPETFLAVPDAGMIFRLSRWQDRVQVQAYRSASGELLAEVPLASDTLLTIEEVTLDVETQPLSRYRAVYNPGAVLEGLGALGIVASLMIGHHPDSQQADAAASDEPMTPDEPEADEDTA